MHVRILDLDNSVARQSLLCRQARGVIPLRRWGPRLRLACGHAAFADFESDLAGALAGRGEVGPVVSFLGSGDFHHVSLALLRRLDQPCNLLVIDNHPDWMRGLPFLHCGTWLYHAAGLPQVGRIFHVGGDVDFDNRYRWLAPWPLLRSGKITVMPAARSFRNGSWAGIAHEPLRRRPEEAAPAGRVEELLRPWLEDLASLPLYVSLDRDVLQTGHAAVNWDSGRLLPSEVLGVIEAFVAASAALAGMDVVGDWSRVRVSGWGRKLMHWAEHPRQEIDPGEADRQNECFNLRVLDHVRGLVRHLPTPTPQRRLVWA